MPKKSECETCLFCKSANDNKTECTYPNEQGDKIFNDQHCAALSLINPLSDEEVMRNYVAFMNKPKTKN